MPDVAAEIRLEVAVSSIRVQSDSSLQSYLEPALLFQVAWPFVR